MNFHICGNFSFVQSLLLCWVLIYVWTYFWTLHCTPLAYVFIPVLILGYFCFSIFTVILNIEQDNPPPFFPLKVSWQSGGRWEGGSGWGTHVNPWLIHVNVWQKPLQYCKVISLQLIKIIEKKSILAINLQPFILTYELLNHFPLFPSQIYRIGWYCIKCLHKCI